MFTVGSNKEVRVAKLLRSAVQQNHKPEMLSVLLKYEFKMTHYTTYRSLETKNILEALEMDLKANPLPS